MIIQPLQKLYQKMGKFFFPAILLFFLIGFNGLLFSSVKQRAVDYKEGQVAEQNIRANKTIENTKATLKKRQLAAEAVSPEYTYQEELGKKQRQLLESLFLFIEEVEKEKEEKEKTTTAKANNGKVVISTDEEIATLKKKFEQVDTDDLNYYQQFSNDYFEKMFALPTHDLSEVKNFSLNLLKESMKSQIREANYNETLEAVQEKVTNLHLTKTQTKLIETTLENSIVINTFLNQKRTDELRQTAKESVQPVMIYQGEIIVREGSQIDSTAIEKLNLLGMTSSKTSYFPVLAMLLTSILLATILIYFVKTVDGNEEQMITVSFFTIVFLTSLIMMKFFQFLQTNNYQYIPLFYPAAFAPVLTNLFLNRRAGIFTAIAQLVASLFIFYDLIGTNVLTVILVSYLFSGFMGTLVQKKKLMQQGKASVLLMIFFPFLMNVILVIFQGMSITDDRLWIALLCSLGGNILAFLLVIGLYPYIELLLTDNSMMVLNELSNPNHPLLKQLLEEAPGTYHHSMMVANLSANAVAEIGGQSLLTRVACYYHDIGKLKHANFFVENLPDGAENPHNFLLPEDSKQIIFGHVTDGVALLTEKKMPQLVIDICQQHHGTTLVKYFYVMAQKRNLDVEEEAFRYPGPIPQTREAAVVSIADSCEAAVRAMDKPTNEKIAQFVHQLIEDRILDGQLDDSGLTMKELRLIEKSLINGLCSTFHSRIKYPKMSSEAQKMKEEQERSEP